MTEYTIVGVNSVNKVLELLKPYIRLKKPQVQLATQIYALVADKYDLNKFIKAAELVDRFGELNYSKRRVNTSSVLKAYLRKHDLYPCND